MSDEEIVASLEAELAVLPGERPAGKTPAAVQAGAAPAPGREKNSPRRVMVIDDNKGFRDLVRAILSAQGYQVMEAKDGSEGLALMLDEAPDLIIVDFAMPRGNGYEFVQTMKSSSKTRGIPIIMISGASNRHHIKDLGLDLASFLYKPVPNAALLAAVVQALPPTDAGTAADKPEGTLASPAAPAAGSPSLEDETSEVWEADESTLDLIKVEREPETEEVQGLDALSKDSPLTGKVNQILLRAVEMGASDIHIEPQERQVVVRVRIDGSLRKLCAVPLSERARLSARVKIMAELDITERRLPQDGQFQARVKGRSVDFRVSTLPSDYGEKIVLRILGQSQLTADLSQLGMNPRDLGCVKKTLKSPHGLVLVTGPTGSGKTTTLYTMIGALNTPEVNIMTAEDPIEYRLVGVTQAQINPSIGLNFETVLRAFLRQDPNIILVGEIRDKETAEIAVKASITGHLVFSTLHTNSASATILRLTHMGMAAYLVAASVKLVVAQHLIRLLCPECKVPQSISEEDKRCLTEEQVAALKTVFRPRGCPACRGVGYAGRRPIFEVMPVEFASMRQAILAPQGSGDALADLALKEGMVPLSQAALLAVADGTTSLQEAYPIVLGQ